MSLASNSLLSIILLLFLFTTTFASIQNLLRSQGLPGGLFPDNVKSYNLDEAGRLEVHLEDPCVAKFETRVYFDSVIRANLSYGGLVGLEGLSQLELFLWLPVKGIVVSDPGLILFDIGLAHKQLSLSLFEDPPICKPQVLCWRLMEEKWVLKCRNEIMVCSFKKLIIENFDCFNLIYFLPSVQEIFCYTLI